MNTYGFVDLSGCGLDWWADVNYRQGGVDNPGRVPVPTYPRVVLAFGQWVVESGYGQRALKTPYAQEAFDAAQALISEKNGNES